MDVFKQQLQRIQEQLAGLNGTQRMLVMALVAVMVLTLLLWSRYAATPDRVPLLTTAVRDQDQAKIVNALTARGISHTASGGNIMVSPDDSMRALAVVTSENLVPAGSSNLLDDFLSRGTPFDSQDKNSKVWKLLLAQHIQSMLMLMPGVREARVTVDTASVPRFGTPINPTAAVFLVTETPAQRVNPAMIEGIASMVCGSVSGMKKADVQIVVDTRPYPLDSALAGGGGGDLLERKSEFETYFANKVVRQLSYIGGVLVSVSAQLNTESKESVVKQVDEIKSKETEITSKTSESTQANAGASDPGVGANTSSELAVAASTTNGNTTSTEESVTKMENFPSQREERSMKPAGDATPLAATVAVPRSYFVKQVKDVDPSSTKEPDLAAIDAKVASESLILKEAVQKCLGLADASSVQIAMYVDSPAELPTSGSSGGLLSTTFGGNMKEILIGLLAVISLFMVSMIVKKSTPAPLIVPEPVKKARGLDVQSIDGNEELIGIAAPGMPTLEAMELGADEMKGQQMVDQVNNMVKEDPDAAAQLVKRWLSRS